MIIHRMIRRQRQRLLWHLLSSRHAVMSLMQHRHRPQLVLPSQTVHLHFHSLTLMKLTKIRKR